MSPTTSPKTAHSGHDIERRIMRQTHGGLQAVEYRAFRENWCISRQHKRVIYRFQRFHYPLTGKPPAATQLSAQKFLSVWIGRLGNVTHHQLPKRIQIVRCHSAASTPRRQFLCDPSSVHNYLVPSAVEFCGQCLCMHVDRDIVSPCVLVKQTFPHLKSGLIVHPSCEPLLYVSYITLHRVGAHARSPFWGSTPTPATMHICPELQQTQ